MPARPQAIQRLDEVIQQNAASAEEMASTSEELSGQAEQLQEMMATFKLDKMALPAPAGDSYKQPQLPQSSSQSSAAGNSRGNGRDSNTGSLRQEQGSHDQLDNEFERY